MMHIATRCVALTVALSCVSAMGCGAPLTVVNDPVAVTRGSVYASFVQSYLAHYSGEPSAAAEHARRALDADPTDRELYLLCGEMLARNGELDEAVEVLLEGVEVAPLWWPLSLALSRVYDDLGNTDAAEAVLLQAVANAPDALAPHEHYAQLQARLGDLPGAIATLEGFLQHEPDDAAAWRRIGRLYNEQERFGDAVDAYDAAHQIDPNTESDLAYIVANAGAMDEFTLARAYLDECLTQFRQSVSCRVEHIRNLAREREAGGLTDDEVETATYEILRSLGRAVGANPTKLRRVEYLVRRELDTHRGFIFLQTVAADRPRNTQIQSQAAWAASRNGDITLSIKYMANVLRVRPRDADALNFIGYTWAENGIHLKAAEIFLLRALEIRPGDGNIQDSLGWAYYQMGRLEEAVVWLESAVALDPENSVLLEHLADACGALGEIGRAVDLYNAALTNADPDRVELIEQKIHALQTS